MLLLLDFSREPEKECLSIAYLWQKSATFVTGMSIGSYMSCAGARIAFDLLQWDEKVS
ncbi:MAG: hypothetical protein ABI180_11305 [Microcoleus sp.]